MDMSLANRLLKAGDVLHQFNHKAVAGADVWNSPHCLNIVMGNVLLTITQDPTKPECLDLKVAEKYSRRQPLIHQTALTIPSPFNHVLLYIADKMDFEFYDLNLSTNSEIQSTVITWTRLTLMLMAYFNNPDTKSPLYADRDYAVSRILRNTHITPTIAVQGLNISFLELGDTLVVVHNFYGLQGDPRACMTQIQGWQDLSSGELRQSLIDSIQGIEELHIVTKASFIRIYDKFPISSIKPKPARTFTMTEETIAK